MTSTQATAASAEERARWAPALGSLRLVGDGRTVAVLAPDATVRWWCAPDFDDPPLCWDLLDPAGGSAGFPHLSFVDRDEVPAGVVARTRLRGADGIVEVRDGLLGDGTGVALVRLVRQVPDHRGPARRPVTVEHRLRLGGFGADRVDLQVRDGEAGPDLPATGRHRSRGADLQVTVRAARHRHEQGALVSTLDVPAQGWAALVVAVGCDPGEDVEELVRRLDEREAAEREDLAGSRLPRSHPGRALDALAVIRACTYGATGAVVASPTTSLPEAVGHDRQFDYRYTWLRDASLATAVAALLGKAGEARRYLDFVHEAWEGRDLLTNPLLDVRGGEVPGEQEVAGVSGWGASRPVRVGNDARGQRQHDAVGLLVEAVSVYVQAGGRLDDRTWDLVTRLADQVADDEPGRSRPSHGIWEVREEHRLVDGDIGRWLVLDRALWIARGWRPTTRRRRWKDARDTVARRVRDAVAPDGTLPQSYDGDPDRPDASSLMAVAFGLLDADDARAGRLVDAVLSRLGTGAHVRRYPPGDDGFSGVEGAFVPMSFLAVTALARLGRVEEAQQRLDRLCGELPRLLSEEVDPETGDLLGNTPLVWSHAELARAVYVLDAARLRARWGRAGLSAWRITRYLRLRADREHDDARPRTDDDPTTGTQEER